MPISLTTHMDAIATAADTATGVSRAFGYPVEDAMPGDAIVGYPTEFEAGVTYGRGLDHAVFPLWVVCGLQQDKSARDFAAGVIKDDATNVKAAIEASSTLNNLGAVSVSLGSSPFEAWAIPANGGPLHVVVRFEVEVTA